MTISWSDGRSAQGVDNVRAYWRARSRAISQLRQLHRDEYDRLLADQLAKADRPKLQPGPHRKLTAEEEIAEMWGI